MLRLPVTPLKDVLDALNQLGLTRYQAKVYFSLLGKKPSSANEIAQLTSLNRGNIYTTLDELYNLGLVQKIITSPTKYRAVQIEDAVSILIGEKTSELTEIQTLAKELIDQIKTGSDETEDEVERNVLSLVPGKHLLSTAEKTCNNAMNSIDYIFSYRKFISLISVYPDIYFKALERGVEIRLILDKPPPDYSIPKAMANLMCKPGFKVHYVPTRAKAHLSLCDSRRVIFNTSTSDKLTDSPCYLTENPCLVSALKEYFEMLWSTTAKQDA